MTHLDLFEGHLEGEGLIVVRVQGALLDAGLLLFQPLAVLHDGNLHVGICKRTERDRLDYLSSLGVRLIKSLGYSPDNPPTSIFLRFLASRMTTVSLPAVGT